MTDALEVLNKIDSSSDVIAMAEAIGLAKEEIKRLREIAQPVLEAQEKRAEHARLMETDPIYVDRCNHTTVPEDKTITVTMKVKERYDTHELFASMFRSDHPLVAGCEVLSIGYTDVVARSEQLRKDIQAVLDGRLSAANMNMGTPL